jgi:hypothetical protein
VATYHRIPFILSTITTMRVLVPVVVPVSVVVDGETMRATLLVH